MVKKQKKIILDDYENEILEAFESGTLVPSHSKTDFQAIAKNTMKKQENQYKDFRERPFRIAKKSGP